MLHVSCLGSILAFVADHVRRKGVTSRSQGCQALLEKKGFIISVACRHLIPRIEHHLTLLGCYHVSDCIRSRNLACEIDRVRRLNGDIGGLDFPPEGESTDPMF
jgi:hypothetical protein